MSQSHSLYDINRSLISSRACAFHLRWMEETSGEKKSNFRYTAAVAARFGPLFGRMRRKFLLQPDGIFFFLVTYHVPRTVHKATSVRAFFSGVPPATVVSILHKGSSGKGRDSVKELHPRGLCLAKHKHEIERIRESYTAREPTPRAIAIARALSMLRSILSE